MFVPTQIEFLFQVEYLLLDYIRLVWANIHYE